jgi:peptidoglycan-N-acetylglucosamine deacetylase
MGELAVGRYRCRMAPGSPAQTGTTALLRRAALVAPLLLSLAMVPGTAWAADPHNLDVIPAPLVSQSGGPARPAVSPPGLGTAQPPVVVFHGPRTDRVVALTFDDGYAPANVRQIFAELTRAGVAATFFVNGAYLRWDPKLWRSIAEAGYPIGNHTVLHEDVRNRPPGQVAADLARNARLVLAATGRPMIPVFRPPYGYHDAASDAAASAAGFPTIVLWDVTGGDASLRATDASVLANASAGRPGSIILLHAGPSVTPRILPALIAGYQARGFTFVTVPELLGITTPDAGLPGGGAASTPPESGGVVAPTPPAVAPAGDDRGGVPITPVMPISPVTPITPVTPGGVPAPSAGAVPAPPAGEVTARHGSGPTAAAPQAGWDSPPLPPTVAGSRGLQDAPSLARDEAWARGPVRDGIVATATVALLGLLLLLGAIVGRRARRGGS